MMTIKMELIGKLSIQILIAASKKRVNFLPHNKSQSMTILKAVLLIRRPKKILNSLWSNIM